ncbi:MAG: metallophosphoesterase [Pirellulales bacterium]|nr:metallophosphoesterase [Pirellulales bacterium]
MRRGIRWLLAAALVSLAGLVVWGYVRATPQVGPAPQPVVAAEAPLWRFGFVGDTQQGETVFEEIFRQLASARVQFVLHLGDMVENADSTQQWEYLLAKAEASGLRLMPVVGNHDCLPGYRDRGESCFRRFFPQLPETFYHFRFRDLNFLMLNSERSFLPWSEQAGFLRWQLAHHPGTTIVCLHRPIFSSSRRDLANQYLRRALVHGTLVDSDVVLVLAGHHHTYERMLPLDGITYVVSGGGSRKLYPAEPPQGYTAVSRPQVNHYGVVDVYADRLVVRVMDVAGVEFDRFAIALRPTTHAVGSARNPPSMELVPLEGAP